MASIHLPTRGYGNGSLVGTIPLVVLRGYVAGASAIQYDTFVCSRSRIYPAIVAESQVWPAIESTVSTAPAVSSTVKINDCEC